MTNKQHRKSNVNGESRDEYLDALNYHSALPRGKVGLLTTKPLDTEEELSLAYSPGVAAPVREIASDPSKIYDYTAKGNSVAVITNGTAILGLGNLGAAAAKPVMEGKAALFKRFSGIDAVDLEIDETSPDAFIAIVKSLEPTFAGINLEDIKSPECFVIEKQLQSIMEIPVFHDDQHGTAIVLVAALINACAHSQRTLITSRIVINGAGAAGLSCARLLFLLGVPKNNLIMCDIAGVLHKGRESGIHEWHRPYVRDTTFRTVAEAIVDADIVIGLSAKGAFTSSMISTMAKQPIIFALANPEPEILPTDVLAVRRDAIVATGRSDFPNQVNNLLAFPYIFRGALDVRATRITDGMILAAVNALVKLSKNNSKTELLPSVFNPRLVEVVAGAISKAAIEDGVAQLPEPYETGPVSKVANFFERSNDETVRMERDPLGEVAVPASRYFGPQTLRAIKNFQISGKLISEMPELIRALAWVKKAAAITNSDVGAISEEIGDVIGRACDEIIDGHLHSEFCIDVLQGGAGTSTNMNANEVIANRALELFGWNRGDYHVIHPLDHVNCSQSTNDSYATAVRLTIYQLCEKLEWSVQLVVDAFQAKAVEFSHIQKLGRTQLQDAVPMSAGEEIGAFAETLFEDIARIREMKALFLEVNLGGTAIGTGVGAGVEYQKRIVKNLETVSGLKVLNAKNRIEATSDMGAFTLFSGLLKRFAVKLSKISNDLRLLSSGPVAGLGEMKLPDVQPGSSIMPGKVNPVIPEVVNQVCFKVFGSDTAITFAAEAGQLQLNAMEPLILNSLHESCSLLVSAMDTLVVNCINGIEIDEKRCRENLEASTALATNLVPHIGYDSAAEIAKSALKAGVPFVAYVEKHHGKLAKYVRIGDANI